MLLPALRRPRRPGRRALEPARAIGSRPGAGARPRAGGTPSPAPWPRGRENQPPYRCYTPSRAAQLAVPAWWRPASNRSAKSSRSSSWLTLLSRRSMVVRCVSISRRRPSLPAQGGGPYRAYQRRRRNAKETSSSGASQNIKAKPHIVRSSRPLDGPGLPGLFDVLGRLPQDLRDALERRIVRASAPCALEGGSGQLGEGTLDFAQTTAGEVAYGLTDPVEDLVEQVTVLLQVPLAFGRHVIHLLPRGLNRPDVALVLQELECWVHRPSRWCVVAAHLFLQGLDHLVAVSRLLLEQSENHELHFSRLEHLVPAPGAFGTGPRAPPSGAGEPRSEAPVFPCTAHDRLLTVGMSQDITHDIS